MLPIGATTRGYSGDMRRPALRRTVSALSAALVLPLSASLAGCTGESVTKSDVKQGPTEGPSVSITGGSRGPSPNATGNVENPR